MLRWFRVDLVADLGTDRLTWRRLGVLLGALPRESMFVRAVAGDAAAWGPAEHLLANVVDMVTMLNHNLVQSRSTKKLPKPTFMARPGVKAPEHGVRKLEADVHTMAEMRKILDEWSD